MTIADMKRDKLSFSDLDEFQKDALIEELLKKVASLEFDMTYKKNIKAYKPMSGGDSF